MASPLKLLFLSLATGAFGQDMTPSGPTQPGTASNCNKWYTVKSGDGCYSVETAFGITHAQFIAWNPAVSDDCITKFWPTFSYCVGVGVGSAMTSSSSSTGVISTSVVSTSSSVSDRSSTTNIPSRVNATYSIRNPITSYNLSTPTIDRKWPPTKTQTGQPSYCNKWYLIEGGDTCEIVYRKFATSISRDDLLAWNPALDSDCSGLYYGWWVCVGVQLQSSLTLTYITKTGPVTIPTYEPFTPTAFPTINSSFTAAPTQSGLPSDCGGFYQAASNDTCNLVLKQFNYITREQFFEWNPALQGNCDGLWAQYWYCVANFPSGSLPMPPTVTTAPSRVQTGIASSCVAWYQMTVSDTCDSIAAMFGTFSSADFRTWNPAVWLDCSNIQEGYSYCVAVPGTPTTRTSPIGSTTLPPMTTSWTKSTSTNLTAIKE